MGSEMCIRDSFAAVLVGVVVLIGRRGIGKSFVPKLAQAAPLIGGAAGIYWVTIRALF